MVRKRIAKRKIQQFDMKVSELLLEYNQKRLTLINFIFTQLSLRSKKIFWRCKIIRGIIGHLNELSLNLLR